MQAAMATSRARKSLTSIHDSEWRWPPESLADAQDLKSWRPESFGGRTFSALSCESGLAIPNARGLASLEAGRLYKAPARSRISRLILSRLVANQSQHRPHIAGSAPTNRGAVPAELRFERCPGWRCAMIARARTRQPPRPSDGTALPMSKCRHRAARRRRGTVFGRSTR